MTLLPLRRLPQAPLTDAQRYAIATAYREFFRPQAEENLKHGGRPKKGTANLQQVFEPEEAKRQSGGDKRSEKAKETVTANLQEPKAPVNTAKQAAEISGMSKAQFHKAPSIARLQLRLHRRNQAQNLKLRSTRLVLTLALCDQNFVRKRPP